VTNKKINKLSIVDDLILKIVLVANIYINVFVKMIADYSTKIGKKKFETYSNICVAYVLTK